MRELILLSVISFLSLFSSGQTDPPPTPPGQEIVMPDEFAEFPGGASALKTYLTNMIILPTAVTEKGVEGKVYMRFVVSEEGSISEVKIAKKLKDCPECDKEAIRVIKGMPKWNPAKKNGKKITSYFYLPVSFKAD